MVDQSVFPNPLSSDTDKNNDAFGKKLMDAAIQAWKRGTGGEDAAAQKARFEYNRLFASGKQPMQEYKDILDIDGDLAVVQLSYDPLPIAIPFLNRMYDRYVQRDEKIQANAVDPVTQSKKEKAKADALFKLKNKEKIMALQENAGVQLEEFSDSDPQDESELNIEFGFNYKEREEVIIEQGIDLIFYDNNWYDILKPRILKDLAECGRAQLHPYIDPNGRIKIEFTLPENIISSYTDYNDFHDCSYQGGLFMMSIADIRMKYPEKVKAMGGEEALFNLARSNSKKNGNGTLSGTFSDDRQSSIKYDGFKVEVAEISFKLLNNIKWEVNTDRFGKEVLDKVKVIKDNKKYVQSPPFEVEYTGVMIADTDYLLEWGTAKNQVKSDHNLTEVKLPWVTFMHDNNKMNNTPLVETMIPSIKKMQLADLQQQKIIASMAPDGYDVDISTLSDIDLGDCKGVRTPADLYSVYKQTGIKYWKWLSDDGEEQRRVPIQSNSNPYSSKLEQLMGVWNQEYDKLIKIIGSNNLDAGQISNQAVGNKVLENARQMGESASNFIYGGYLNMMKRAAYIVMMRLWDILVHGKKDGIHFYDGYRQALGTDRIEYIKLEATDDFEKTQFDVKIQAVLDDKELESFAAKCQQVLAGDPTMLPDVVEAERLAKSNMKYAVYFLMARYRKRQKEIIEQASRNNKENTEAAIAAAQEKGKQDQELELLKAKIAGEARVEAIEETREIELVKYTSILKIELLRAHMAKEGNTIAGLPAFVFDSVGLVDKSSKQLLMEEMAEIEAEQQEKAMIAEQQAMAQQEQMMAEQQQVPPQEQTM